MNTSTLKTGLALLSTGWTVVAGAETLIHYHLDDLEVGTRGKKDTVFVNAANPGTRDGKAVTFDGGKQDDYTWLYPIGTNGLPEVWRYFDPVKNAAHDAGRALSTAPVPTHSCSHVRRTREATVSEPLTTNRP